ncbi:MAG TPA: uL22 family ribosomal protein [Candidatus Baltobacteraceae bacterium]|nr:uL22 family ribosomal protein [Candidatus Baltobacteraceae bacterium]
MKYSYNLDRTDIVFAAAKDINASYKDLCAVCDAVRFRSLNAALNILDGVIYDGKAVLYRRHNAYMASRGELQGQKGRFPKKCAAIVKKVLVNAAANAENKGFAPDLMFVVHIAANKTLIAGRSPPKGVRSVSTGGYGYSSMRRSDLEFARVEIGLSTDGKKTLSPKTKTLIKTFSKFDINKRVERALDKRQEAAKKQRKSDKDVEGKTERHKHEHEHEKPNTKAPSKTDPKPASQPVPADAPMVTADNKV